MGIGPEAKDAIPTVMKMLDSDDFHTQYWACRALGAIGSEASCATGKLAHLVTSGVTSVRRNAAKALGNIGPSVGEEGVHALLEGLNDPNQPVKQQAVIALGKLKPVAESAADKIEALLKQKPRHFSPRAEAAKSLWQLRPKSEAAVIEALLNDLSSADVEPWLAAQYLAEINFAQDVIPRIVPLLESDRRGVRQFAALALGNFAAEAAGVRMAIEPLLQDTAPEVREAATAALQQIDGTRP
jgi:HEAT repeat protein